MILSSSFVDSSTLAGHVIKIRSTIFEPFCKHLFPIKKGYENNISGMLSLCAEIIDRFYYHPVTKWDRVTDKAVWSKNLSSFLRICHFRGHRSNFSLGVCLSYSLKTSLPILIKFLMWVYFTHISKTFFFSSLTENLVAEEIYSYNFN